MTFDKARARLAELNKLRPRIPTSGTMPRAAQRVMQERTRLEDQLTSIAHIERELDDQTTLIQLAGERKGRGRHRRG